MTQPLNPADLPGLLRPYLAEPAEEALCLQVSRYLGLLALWNRRVSLTAVRAPEQIVQRHFGEGFFLAEHLQHTGTLLDFGSGAGFPGIPIALLRPGLQITLAESQQKKASFLREAVEQLGLSSQVSVWAGRIETMPMEQRFDIVAMRAVDRMSAALGIATGRVAPAGKLAVLAGEGTPLEEGVEGWQRTEWPIPLSAGHCVLLTAPEFHVEHRPT